MAVQDGQILPLQTVKDKLDIAHSEHDDLLGEMIEEAEAELQSHLGVPIAGRTFTEYHDGGKSTLFLKRRPLDGSSVTVTDTLGTKGDVTDDETEEVENFRVDEDAGLVIHTTDNGIKSEWEDGVRRFKVQYTAGLDQGEDWDDYGKARIRRSLRYLVCSWYEKIPGVREDTSGPLSVIFEPQEVPDSVLRVWGRRIKL